MRGRWLTSEARAIGPDETSDAVERDLAQIGAALLVRSVADLDAAAPVRWLKTSAA